MVTPSTRSSRASVRHLAGAAGRFAVPLAAIAAMASFARFQREAQGAAESAYLALVGGLLLLAVAALSEAPFRLGRSAAVAGARRDEAAVASLLVTLAVWALPSGPMRGTAVMAVAAAALAFAAGRRLHGAAAPAAARAFAWALPLAVALQVMLRSERLVAPPLDARFLAGLLGLPLVAAAATALLATRYGLAAAAVAAALTALLGPGFTTVGVVGLAAVALAEVGWRPPAALPPAARVALRLVLGAAAVALLLLLPRGGTVAVASGLLLAGWPPARARRGADPAAPAGGGRWRAALHPLVPVAVAVGALALAFPVTLVSRQVIGDRLTLAAVLLPAFPLALGGRRDRGRRRLLLLAGVVALIVAGARAAEIVAALAAPLAVAALAAGGDLPTEGRVVSGQRRLAFAPQAVWTAVLVVVTALAGAYPWVRHDALGPALARFGLRPTAEHGLVAVAAWGLLATVGLVAAGWGTARWRGRRPRPIASSRVPVWGHPAGWAVALLAVVALGELPPATTSLLGVATIVLDAARPTLVVDVAERMPRGLRSLTVDSNLSHAAGLAADAPVATVRLLDGDGNGREWTLRAGDETAEWAARRPDVVVATLHGPPPPWVAWVAPEGDFLGQTYRSRWEVPAPLPVERIEVRRDPRLPADTTVHLYRLEGRR